MMNNRDCWNVYRFSCFNLNCLCNADFIFSSPALVLVFLTMLRDGVFRFTHLGGVSEVKPMFSLLVYLLVTMAISYLVKSLMNFYKIRLGSKLPYFFP